MSFWLLSRELMDLIFIKPLVLVVRMPKNTVNVWVRVRANLNLLICGDIEGIRVISGLFSRLFNNYNMCIKIISQLGVSAQVPLGQPRFRNVGLGLFYITFMSVCLSIYSCVSIRPRNIERLKWQTALKYMPTEKAKEKEDQVEWLLLLSISFQLS